ncbi:hypothetical protein FIV42_22340 [Persicimonas caeni]|uniref:Trm112 family protein n=1 Tax=Persicimonas caeni TaxID=2292766 RepID=A0A4Y6PYI3_PERCE|nr:hypothetical protein [Persicimonas caeni]QDG53382.1 hypothetical protein FIV42_22340 [Persicimonas caeni]QED34603.1 hypothetical protein FRD00_22335 [Persicimonas caeni]
MASADSLSKLLRCPETRQELRPLDDSKLDELNEAIRAGELHNHAGDEVEQTLDAGLIREDDAVVYPIRDGVPNLLIDDRIPLKDSD